MCSPAKAWPLMKNRSRGSNPRRPATKSVVQYKSSAKTKKPKKGRATMKAGQDNIWVVEVTQDGKDVVYSRPATREVARDHKREAKQDGYTNVQIVQYKRGAVIR